MTDSDKNNEGYFNFTTRQLMLAVACFAVATTIIICCLNAPPSPDIGDISLYMLFLFSPATGASIGLGIGCLLRQKLAGVLVGFLVPAILLTIALIYLDAH